MTVPQPDAIPLGFTGTRDGMTQAQMQVVHSILLTGMVEELHHGDCVGADAEAHALAQSESVPLVLHPPEDDEYQAYCSGPGIRSKAHPKPYLVRNRQIVYCTKELIATPAQDHEIKRSGTWATVRVARNLDRKIYIVPPDGRLWTEGPQR